MKDLIHRVLHTHRPEGDHLGGPATVGTILHRVASGRHLFTRELMSPCDHKAIVAGGLGGSGKTTVLATNAEIDLSQYLMINPDDIKEEMAR